MDRRGEIDFASLMDVAVPEVKAQAAAALLPTDPEHYKALIQKWIDSPDDSVRKAGVIAAGVSGDAVFIPFLSHLLDTDAVSGIRAAVLRALKHIQPPDINTLVAPYLQHESPNVRQAALDAFMIVDKPSLRQVIDMLVDPSETVSKLAKAQILEAPYQDGKQLIKSLSSPRRKIREEIFRILEDLDIKGLDAVRFVKGQAEGAYKYLVEAEAVAAFEDTPVRHLLEDHLRQEGQLQVENIIRVLAVQDATGKMRIVSRGLLSADARQRANSLEALGDILDKSIVRILMPLLDASPLNQKTAAGKKLFKLKAFAGSGADLIHHLLQQKHWVTRSLALEVASLGQVNGLDLDRISTAVADPESKQVRLAARRLLQHLSNDTIDEEALMEGPMAISERILLLKRIDIFAGLSVSELSAIASVTEEIDYLPGVKVIQEGDTGETLYLIISGTVAVVKQLEDGSEIELDQIGEGDYFGEMALFEDTKRSASIVTQEGTRLLFLHKQDFNEMVREYPQIALAICNALSDRIRKLHQKMKA
jgi:HEAT repeat protein